MRHSSLGNPDGYHVELLLFTEFTDRQVSSVRSSGCFGDVPIRRYSAAVASDRDPAGGRPFSAGQASPADSASLLGHDQPDEPVLRPATHAAR